MCLSKMASEREDIVAFAVVWLSQNDFFQYFENCYINFYNKELSKLILFYSLKLK